jgi:hypothetical protein
MQAAAESEVAPPEATSNGVFGRFRCAPALEVFVVVTSVHDDVAFYRPVRDYTGVANREQQIRDPVIQTADCPMQTADRSRR